MQVNKNQGVHEKGELTLSEVLEQVRRNPEFHKAGAIGIFIGVVRGKTPRGEPVRKLALEAYEEKANEDLRRICEELQKRKGVIDAQIHHFIGEFDVGEDLVYVVVAGAHRQDVFLTLEEAVDRYKKEVPIFKKEWVLSEQGTPRSYWVSERETS